MTSSFSTRRSVVVSTVLYRRSAAQAMILPSRSVTANAPLVTSSMSSSSEPCATVTPCFASGSKMLLMWVQSSGRARRVPSYRSRLTIAPTPSSVYSSNKSAPGTV